MNSVRRGLTLVLSTPWLTVGLLALYLAVVTWWPGWWNGVLIPAAIVQSAIFGGIGGGLVAALFGAVFQLYGLILLEHDWPGPAALLTLGWALVAQLLLAVAVGIFRGREAALRGLNAELTLAQDRLAALYRVAISMSSTLDIRELLDIILRDAVGLLGYPDCQLLLADEESGDLIVEAVHGSPLPLGLRLPKGEGITGWVMETGQPVAVGDVQADRRYVSGTQGARSEACVPLQWDGRILGVLNTESPEPDKYGEADLQLLATVAEQAAAYIANARLHQQTKRMAMTDPSTGLFNYRHFQDRLADLVHEYQASGGTFSLLMIDVDFFKNVNDSYGHPTGDAVLKQVARLLQENVRGGDVVFRYGGEEFAIILPNTDKATALRVAERIRERIGRTVFLSHTGRPLPGNLTASLGVGNYPEDALAQVDLLIRADGALYAAKSAGRNRVVQATPPPAEGTLPGA